MIQSVKWSINNRCNLHCPFCFADEYFTENSLEDKFKIIDKLYSDGIPHIDFFGKEPLLDDTIFKLCEYIEEKYSILMSTSLITNGVNLKEYSEDIIKHYSIIEVTVSYDLGVTRQFAVDLSDLKYLKDNEVLTEITIDLQKDNVDKIKNFEWETFANTLYINPIYSKSGNYTLTKSEFEDFLKTYEGNDRVTVRIPFEYGNIVIPDHKYKLHQDTKCSAGREHLFIASDGKCYGCNMCAFNHKEEYSCDYLSTSLEDIQKICSSRSNERCCV